MSSRLRTTCIIIVALAFVLAVAWNSRAMQRLRSTPRPDRAIDATSSDGVVVSRSQPNKEGEPTATGAKLVGWILARADDSPVAGAKIYAATSHSFVDGDRVALSDANGRFELELARPGTLQVVARGFRAGSREIEAEEREITIRLERGLSIGGRVVTTDGKPIEGVRVWAHRHGNVVAWPNAEELMPGKPQGGNVAVSGAHGAFEIAGLTAGTYQVRARLAGYSQLDWHEPPAPEAGKHDLVVKMLPVLGIEVSATNADTGEPVSAVQMGFQTSRNLTSTGDLVRGESVPRARPMGDNGEGMTRIYFAKQASGPAHVRVLLAAPGYLRGSAEAELNDPLTRINVKLKQARSGRPGRLVVTADFEGSGAPFDGWLTLTMRSRGSTGTRVLRFVDGKATDAVVLPPGPYQYRAGGAGDVGFWWTDGVQPGEFEIFEDGKTALKLALRGTLVDLEVVDADGSPVRGYDLVINPPKHTGAATGIVARWDTPANHAHCLRWRAGYDGPDVILPPGKVKIGAWMEGVGRALAVVDIAGNGDRINIRLPLREADR